MTHTSQDATSHRGLPAIRMGMVAGVTGLCCVGPTVLAVLAGLVLWALRRRNQCTLDGVRRAWPRLALALGIAVGTYLVLYAVTTWLGTLA